MADKLGLGPDMREIKIGSSFSSNKTAFHTLRYDFKPASVVSGSKNATIDFGSNQLVTVTHLESSGGSQTVFKGSRRPYQKECVLIIDKNTGEITLEKLTTNIQLKKTRPEGNRPLVYNIGNSSGRPPTPVDKKRSPPGMTGSGSGSRGGSSSSTKGGMSQPPPPQAKQSPRQQPSPQYNHRSSPLIVHKSPPQVSNLSLSPSPAASLPMIDDCNDSSSNSFDIGNPLTFPELRDSPEFSNFQEDDGLNASTHVGVLSDSSSDTESESNSSDSDNNPPPPPPPQPSRTNASQPHNRMNGHVNGKSSSSIQNHFLSEDLQLSESGSDSD